jgi:hypothetical protein
MVCVGVAIRPALSTYTPQALGSRPVSAAIPNAECTLVTHPVIATLDHPLFRKRKRGLIGNPLSAEGKRGSTSAA